MLRNFVKNKCDLECRIYGREGHQSMTIESELVHQLECAVQRMVQELFSRSIILPCGLTSSEGKFQETSVSQSFERAVDEDISCLNEKEPPNSHIMLFLKKKGPLAPCFPLFGHSIDPCYKNPGRLFLNDTVSLGKSTTQYLLYLVQ